MCSPSFSTVSFTSPINDKAWKVSVRPPTTHCFRSGSPAVFSSVASDSTRRISRGSSASSVRCRWPHVHHHLPPSSQVVLFPVISQGWKAPVSVITLGIIQTVVLAITPAVWLLRDCSLTVVVALLFLIVSAFHILRSVLFKYPFCNNRVYSSHYCPICANRELLLPGVPREGVLSESGAGGLVPLHRRIAMAMGRRVRR